MKVGFAGTPEFARVALSGLLASAHGVALVLTQPDRPSGRGQKLTASPVKTLAQASGLPVYQPQSLRPSGTTPLEALRMHEVLQAAALDVLVVAAYGLILPPSILDIPRLGCLNIHASLLPRWRGAAPIQRAIEAGDVKTGVTIMQMEAGLDTGPMLLARGLEIGHKSAAELTALLAELGATALLDALDMLERGALRAVAQPNEGVTYAAKVTKAEAVLNLGDAAALLERRIRAFDPAPGASIRRQGVPLKIWQASVLEDANGAPGTVLHVDANGIVIACGSGGLRVESVQEPGGRREPAAQFARRANVAKGEVLT